MIGRKARPGPMSRPALIGSLVIGLVALQVVGCGGEQGGAPSGIGAGIADVSLALSMVSVSQGSSSSSASVPPTVLNNLVQDFSAQAGSFEMVVEGGAVDGSNLIYRYNVVHDTPSGPIGPTGGTFQQLPTGADGSVIEIAANYDAIPLYYLVAASGNFASGTLLVRTDAVPPGASALIARAIHRKTTSSVTYEQYSDFITQTPNPATFPSASVARVINGYAYGLHGQARGVQPGEHATAVYFFGGSQSPAVGVTTVSATEQGGLDGSGPLNPTVALVFDANVKSLAKVIDLTAPGTFTPSYGRVYTVSVPVTIPKEFGAVSTIRVLAKDAADGNGVSQSVAQFFYPVTSGGSVTYYTNASHTGSGLPAPVIDVINRGEQVTFFVDAYLDSAATESYASGSVSTALPNSGSAASAPSVALTSTVIPPPSSGSGTGVTVDPLNLVYNGVVTDEPLYVVIATTDSQGLQYSYTIRPGTSESSLVTYPTPSSADSANITESSVNGEYAANSQAKSYTLVGSAPNMAGVAFTLVDGTTYSTSASKSTLPQAVITTVPEAAASNLHVNLKGVPAAASVVQIVVAESQGAVGNQQTVGTFQFNAATPVSAPVLVPVLAAGSASYVITATAYMNAASGNPYGFELASSGPPSSFTDGGTVTLTAASPTTSGASLIGSPSSYSAKAFAAITTIGTPTFTIGSTALGTSSIVDTSTSSANNTPGFTLIADEILDKNGKPTYKGTPWVRPGTNIDGTSEPFLVLKDASGKQVANGKTGVTLALSDSHHYSGSPITGSMTASFLGFTFPITVTLNPDEGGVTVITNGKHGSKGGNK